VSKYCALFCLVQKLNDLLLLFDNILNFGYVQQSVRLGINIKVGFHAECIAAFALNELQAPELGQRNIQTIAPYNKGGPFFF
jgi:hypothetical protein